MFKLDLEKAEKAEIKLPASVGSYKNQENSIKTPISASLTMLNPLTVYITKIVENSQTDGNIRHLTCLLRNLYVGQETPVTTKHGTMPWFQTGKEVCQGCILSP